MGVTSHGPVIVSKVDGTPLLGQQTSANSIPVVLPSDQTVVVSGTFTADATATAAAPSYAEGTPSPLSQNLSGDLRVLAKQSTSPWIISGAVVAVQSGVWSVGITNTSIAVTGTFFQATQPISAASLPLPAGAMGATGGTVGLVREHNSMGCDTLWN